LIHNLRAGELSAITSVDGDKAYDLAQRLKADHPARIAMERLENPPEWELYDLKNDPVEFVDRSNDPSLADEARRLKQSLHDWQAHTQDPFIETGFRKEVEMKYRPSSK
jgi:N-sulfoglucosamine sulfohydrolase